MLKLLREPLVHFIGAGIIIFLIASLWQTLFPSREAIIVTKQDIRRMASVYSGEAGTNPSLNDLRGMINDHIETVALASEARRLGLDRDDVIVERRLAQKMRFMIDDLADIPNISPAKLEEWYEANRSEFEMPTLYSFNHVYFREHSDQHVGESLSALRNGADWAEKGDAFMLLRQYADLPRSEIVRLFGANFADGIEEAPLNEWVGPQTSSLGTHLIRVERVTPSSSPEFEEIRTQIKSKWRDEQLQLLNQEAIAELVGRYHVEIETIK